MLFGGTNLATNFADTWEWNGTAWAPTAPATSPAPRNGHAMCFDSSRQRTVLFGGTSGAAFYGDTWEWNGTTWQNIPLSGPSARFGHALAFDSGRNRSVLFGGNAAGNASNQTWEWNGTAWAQVGTTGTLPTARSNHALAYDAGRSRTVLFGGISGATVYGDVWEWSGTAWSSSVAAGPSARQGHALAYDSQRQRIVLFGGVNGAVVQADTWEWDGSSWVAVSTSGAAAPNARSSHAMTFDGLRNRTVVFGGVSAGTIFGDTWERIGPTVPMTATQVTTNGTPAPLAGHCLSPLPSGGHLLFGGTNNAGVNGNTMVLANAAWTPSSSVLNPLARVDAALELDSVRNVNVLFGGRSALGTALADTWTFANGQWTFLPQAQAPGARSEHRLTMDRRVGTVLLFGGRDASSGVLSDMWSWNGSAWARITPATPPPARAGHGLAYDAARDRTVLHGGQGALSLLDDLWEYNAAANAWTAVSIPAFGGITWRPSARSDHGFAWDEASERVVVFGGNTASGCAQDTWSFDGASWLLHSQTTAAPAARTRGPLVRDPATKRLRLFGGSCGATSSNDTWDLSVYVVARFANYGNGCPPLSGIVPTLSKVPGTSSRSGDTLGIRLANLPTVLTVALPFFGYNRSSWNGLPLPLDLTAFGMPGCTLWAELLTSGVVVAFTGSADWLLPIPASPFFLGTSLYFQAVVLDAQAGNAQGAVMTNAARVVIGN